MPQALGIRGRAGLRELFSVFLPLAATVAVATVGTALFLSSQFMFQAGRELEEKEADRVATAMKLFTRIDFQSVPVFLSAMAEVPVRDYLFGRGRMIENALRAGERIDQIVARGEYVDSIYLYNEASGVLSTTSGLETGGEASDPELAGMLSRVRELGLSRYIMRRETFLGDKGPRNLYTMILGNMPESGARMRWAFVANLSERRIREELLVAGTTGELFVVDDGGRFLSHPDASLFGTAASADARIAPVLAEKTARGSRSIRGPGGERYLATWADQGEMRWRFISLSPEKAVFAPVLKLRNRVLAAALLFLLAAIGVAFAVSRAVRGRERRSDLAQAYLRGEYEPDGGGAEAASRRLFPALKYPCSAAMLRVDGYRRSVEERGQAILFDLANELSAALAAAAPGSIALRAGENSFLAIVAGTSTESRQAIARAASSIRERRGISLGGRMLARPLAFRELPDAFHGLRELQRLDFLRPEGSIEETSSGADAAGPSDEAQLMKLEKAVRGITGGPEAEKQVQALIERLRETRDPELFRYAAASAATRVLALLGDSADEALPGGASRFAADLGQAERVSEAHEFLSIAAARLADRGDPPSDRRQREIVAKVKAIVDERLADPGLSTAAIAAEVGLSASYLRDLFKRVEGVALYDHVGTERLERAKSLLVGSGDSVREICDRTGFINYSYFFTFFKKSTGKTPTDFRDEAGARASQSRD